MIKINLLGDDTVVDNSGRVVVTLYVASMILLVGLLFLYQQMISAEVADLTAQQGDLQGQLAQLQSKTKEVRELEARRNEIDQKLAVIAKLKLGKKGPVRLLDDLNVAVPDKLWLSEAREAAGVLQLSGLAMDNAAIVDFMKNLEKSDYFKSVDLKESNQVYLIREGSASQKPKSGKGAARGGATPGVTEVQFSIREYGNLSPEQKDAFTNDRPGYGVKVRSFTIMGSITYVGKARLKEIEAAEATPVKGAGSAKGEPTKARAPKSDAGKAVDAAKKAAKSGDALNKALEEQ